MAKKSIQVFLAIFIAGFFMVYAGSGTCHALDVGNENIQINLHPIWIKDSQVHFRPNMDVHVLVTDPDGKKYGYDPIARLEYNDFDGSYGQTSNDDEFFSIEVMFNLINGTYTLEVWADELTEFLMDAYISRRDSTGASLKISGVIDKGVKSKFEFTYTSDPSKPASTAITRLADPSSLKQDITLSGKINWLGNEHEVKKLLKKADKIEEAVAKKKWGKARKELNKFLEEVKEMDEERKKYEQEREADAEGEHKKEHDDKRWITAECVNMLNEDAAYILSTLPATAAGDDD
jgi:hypothetical protein